MKIQFRDYILRSTEPVMGWRSGTVTATIGQLESALGPVQDLGESYADGKVTKRWGFMSPRGPFEVRDYWWNGPNEWSLATPGRKVGVWARTYLRARGLDVSNRVCA